MEIEHVIARGRHLVDRGRPTVMSLYEPGRRPGGGGREHPPPRRERLPVDANGTTGGLGAR
ncbi:hypothetical protein [Actinomadura madurae]|nr:hypothetical protein [Actinomadura madurae]MCP9967704.1 hypothetical protein [Actinomadura madurae]MCQ0008324.1 hypothetical protein [Actinomadura madurae]